jgi:hypothetical protein
LARKESETLRAYADRLDTKLRDEVNSAARKETRIYVKRRERLVAVKEKARAKKAAKEAKKEEGEEAGGKDSYSHGAIPFGFQVEAPPTLVKPRMVLKRVIEPGTTFDADGNVEEKKERKQQPKVDGPGRKVKLKDLGEKDRSVLLAERGSAIDLYRKLKADRMVQRKKDEEDERIANLKNAKGKGKKN